MVLQSSDQLPQDSTLFAEGILNAVDMNEENQLLRLLQCAFKDQTAQTQVEVCQNADLLARVAAKGWHQSLKILLDNKCDVFSDGCSLDTWDYCMWLVDVGQHHPQCVWVTVAHVVKSSAQPAAYVANELYKNYPHLWPGLSGLFTKDICDKALNWAHNAHAHREHPNAGVIVLWNEEQNLQRISHKDFKAQKARLDKFLHISNLKEIAPLEIARWAVMGNFPRIFACIDEHMCALFANQSSKHKQWATDMSYVYDNYEDIAKQAGEQRRWHTSKVQFAYQYNTKLANDLLKWSFDWPTQIVAAVELWNATHNWEWINRLCFTNIAHAGSILCALSYDSVVMQQEHLRRYPKVCDTLHHQWHTSRNKEHRNFCTEIFTLCSKEYQNKYKPPLLNKIHSRGFERILKKHKDKRQPLSAKDKAKKEQKDFERTLKMRQKAVKDPESVWNTVFSGLVDPKKTL